MIKRGKNHINDFSSFLTQLKSKSDIVDIIGGYVRLDQKGNKFWACCPFHNEKTPSFTVSRTAQIYKCFGCGKGGDVITFVMEHERMTFIEAVKLLADKAGMQVPSMENVDHGKQAEILSKKDKMYKIALVAAKHYHDNLRSEQGQKAREYLSSRGISFATATKFGLGISLGYNQLVATLKRQNHSLDLAIEAGILSKHKDGYSDALANRLIVPIINAQSQVVGFGGRSLVKTDFAKYKNTSSSLIFDKSRTLYGINFVKKLKTANNLKNLVIVEGYMDAIALAQAGIENVAASMGTSLTQQQAQLIKRYTNDVFICYDGDSAGQNATLRGLDILKAEGLDVKVVTLPSNQDPDDVVKISGKDGFLKLLDAAVQLIDYKLLIVKAKYGANNDSESKIKYLTEAAAVLSGLKDVEQEHYIKQLAKESGYTDGFIKSLATAQDNEQRAKKLENVMLSTDAESKARYFLTSCLLFGKEFDKLNKSMLISEDGFLALVLEYIFKCLDNGQKPNPSEVYRLANADQNQEKIDALLNIEFSTTIIDKKYFTDSVNLLTRLMLERELAHANNSYNTATDSQQKTEAIKRINEINLQLKQCK